MRISNATFQTLAAPVLLALLAGCSSGNSPLSPAERGQNTVGAIQVAPQETAQARKSGRPKYIFVSSTANLNITVLKATATGPAKPVRTISGSKTDLIDPDSLFVGHTGKLWASNYASSGGTIEAFNERGHGNIAPNVEISGSQTHLDGETGLYVYRTGKIVSAAADGNSLNIFSAASNGNVPPAQIIAGSATQLNEPNGVWVDPMSKNIFVANTALGGAGTAILAFSPTANGNVPPLYEIQGTNTTLCQPTGVVFDSSGSLYVTNSNFFGGCTPAILVFAAGAKGNVAPVRTIAGSNTLLNEPYAVRVDSLGYVYVTNIQGQDVSVFAPGADGNVAPVQNITNIQSPTGLEVH